jgi:hypothetical protein
MPQFLQSNLCFALPLFSLPRAASCGSLNPAFSAWTFFSFGLPLASFVRPIGPSCCPSLLLSLFQRSREFGISPNPCNTLKLTEVTDGHQLNVANTSILYNFTAALRQCV